MSDDDTTPLNPLLMVMAINDDTRFTAGESRALVRAVRHTDNASRQVRMSQAGIAGAVDVSRDTVKRAFKKAHDNGYFSGKQERRNDKGYKVTDYWFKSLPPLGAGEGMDSKAKVQEKAWVADPKVQEKAPSTPSTTNTPYPCFDHGVLGCCEASLGAGEGMASLPSKPCGCNAAQVCPDCRPTPKVESRLSEAKQRELWERQNEAEGLSAVGYFDGEAEIAPERYRVRSQ